MPELEIGGEGPLKFGMFPGLGGTGILALGKGGKLLPGNGIALELGIGGIIDPGSIG
jgi:hypothetical protein